MIATAVANDGAVLGGTLMLGLLLAGIVLWIVLGVAWRASGVPLPVHAVRLRERHWSVSDLLFIGVGLGLALAAIMAITFWLRHQGVDAQWLHFAVAVQNTALQIFLAGLILLRMRRAGGSMRGSFGFDPCRSGQPVEVLGTICKWYVAVLPLVFWAALLSHVLFASKDGDTMFQPVLVMFTHASTPVWFRWWIAGVAVVVAPIVEEAFFRGMLLPVLLRKYDVWVSVFASALLFALVHGHAPAILPLFVLGVGLGTAYVYTGNLLIPVGVHALFNGVSLLVLLLAGVSDTM